MSEPIRSYQRIFRPERRIYQIEGRSLPVPGGVPLRWLAYAVATLLAVIALSSGSSVVLLGAAATGAFAGFAVGGRGGAAIAALGGLVASWLGGEAISLIDWPLRLIVIPAALATAGTQATPDGRRAERFARSWLSLRLAPARRSLGRALPLAGTPHGLGGELWVSPDERATAPRRGRVCGPAIVFFAAAMATRRVGLRGRRVVARRPGARRRGGEETRRVALAAGERLEVRP